MFARSRLAPAIRWCVLVVVGLCIAAPSGAATAHHPTESADDPAFRLHAADEPTALRVMTFNIRFDGPNDGENGWSNREDMAASMIRFYQTDVVGLQEALKGQIDDLQDRLPGYSWLGVGRADGKEGGEYSPIFYRTSRLELLKHDTFWLSETPDVPGSKSWDAAIERVATWAIFRDRSTEEEIFILNTHFDHIGEQARLEAAKLIVDRVPSLGAGRPTVVMGDFNATPEAPPYEALTSGALSDAMLISEHPHHGPTSTWNNFEALVPGHRIDYVFVDDRFRVLRHGILSDSWDGRFPSDHLPVLAEIVSVAD